MNRFLFFAFLIFLICEENITLAQESKKTNVDSIVLTLNIENPFDAEDLTIDLVRPFKTDSEKVRAIYFWITENITYDFKQLRCGSPFFYDYDKYYDFMITRTLLKKKGICG